MFSSDGGLINALIFFLLTGSLIVMVVMPMIMYKMVEYEEGYKVWYRWVVFMISASLWLAMLYVINPSMKLFY